MLVRSGLLSDENIEKYDGAFLMKSGDPVPSEIVVFI